MGGGRRCLLGLGWTRESKQCNVPKSQTRLLVAVRAASLPASLHICFTTRIQLLPSIIDRLLFLSDQRPIPPECNPEPASLGIKQPLHPGADQSRFYYPRNCIGSPLVSHVPGPSRLETLGQPWLISGLPLLEFNKKGWLPLRDLDRASSSTSTTTTRTPTEG